MKQKDAPADWNECNEENFAFKVNPNKEKAKSLIETSEGRIKYAEEKNLNQEKVNYVFEDYYTSLIELVHALVTLEGYNISNHLCLGYYLRDLLKEEKLFRIFDDIRIKRNFLVYYGKRLSFGDALDSIEKSKIIIKEIRLLIKNKFGF